MSESVNCGWKKGKLGDYGEFKNGINYSRNENGDTEYSILNVRDIVESKYVNISNFEKVSINKRKATPYLLQKGDIVIVRSASPGESLIVLEEIDNLIYSGFSIRLRCYDEKHSSFIFQFLQNYKREMDIFSDGTTLKNITQEILKGIEIPLPPLPEQRAIAGVLSSLDDKIELLHRQNKTLEGMAEALWRKMFVEEADPGWKKGKLGDLAKETIGGDWGEDIQSNDLIPVICLRGVDLHKIKESGFSSEAPIRFIKPTSLEKRKLNESEILIAGSGIGPIGKSIPINSALLKCYSYPVVYSNFCKRLRAESKEMAYFIEFLIYHFYKEGELDQFHMGTSVPNFNLKDLLNYEVIFPPRDIVSLFSSFLTDWYNIKFMNQIRALSRLRETLLPKLMSGEVRVKYFS